MATTTVDLTEQDARLVGELVNSGRVKDAGEAVHRGLQLLEKREARDAAKVERMRALVQEGIDEDERGDYYEFHSKEELAVFVQELTPPR